MVAHRSVTLRSEQFGADAYHLRARLESDGNLIIEGHDLGKSPQQFWGGSEYEWEIVVAAEHVPTLVAALDGAAEGDALELLAARFTEDERYATRGFLEERGIPFKFWSRVGD